LKTTIIKNRERQRGALFLPVFRVEIVSSAIQLPEPSELAASNHASNQEIRRKEGLAAEEIATARRQFDAGDIETTYAILRPHQSLRSYMSENELIRQREYENLTFGGLIRAAGRHWIDRQPIV
jgi:hypothetical protein